MENATADDSTTVMLADQHVPDHPEVLQLQPQTHPQPLSAWPAQTDPLIGTPTTAMSITSKKVYMDAMLEGHGVRGKEFHASLFPKVRCRRTSA